MKFTKRVQEILAAYEGESRDTKENLARILMQGRLGGSGRLVIQPVDQGFEHGPARSFAGYPPMPHLKACSKPASTVSATGSRRS